MENANLCVGGCRIKQLTEIIDKILDPETTVVVTTAPAPRSALGEYFGKFNYNAQSKIVGFLKMLGVDYVFDTAFGADLTTISEAYEFIERLKNGNNLPMLNSCCPAFVKYIENFHQELLPNLSTAKTPIAEIATYTKTIFAKLNGIDWRKIYIIALTPCIAKKIEIKGDFITEKQLEYFNNNYTPDKISIKKQKNLSQKSITLLKKLQVHEEQCELSCKKFDVCPKNEKPKNNTQWQLTDTVITTLELRHMIELCGLTLNDIEDANCDDIFGESVKFGASGGVLECVAENAYYLLNKSSPPTDLLVYNETSNEMLEANVPLTPNLNIKVTRIMGLKSLENLIKSPDFKGYKFIEVMACNGGCIGGTGQQTSDSNLIAQRRKILKNSGAKRYAFQNNKALEAFNMLKPLFYDE